MIERDGATEWAHDCWCGERLSRRLCRQFTAALAIVVGLQFVVACPLPAQVLGNGSFETPALSPGQSLGGIVGPDWAFQGGGITHDGFFHRTFDSAPDGLQHAYLRDTSQMEQTVSGLTVGQTYRVEWSQAFAAESGSGGTALAVELSWAGDTQVILPHTLVNNIDWDGRSSDVFVAQSESYTLSFLSDDETPSGYATRQALIDDVRVVPVSAPAVERTHVELDMQLLEGSRIDLEFILGGNVLEGSLGEDLVGPVSVNFDAISGVGVVGWHFNPDQIRLAQDFGGQIDLDILGTADVLIRDAAAILFNMDGAGPHMLHVDESGNFHMGSTFLQFDGEADIDVEGPIASIVDDQTLLLSDVNADDLGSESFGTPITQIGHVDFDPTVNPFEFLVTLDMPWTTVVTLVSDLDLDLKVTGRILARGTVAFEAPEPSTGFLLLSGTVCCAFCWHRRRPRRRREGPCGPEPRRKLLTTLCVLVAVGIHASTAFAQTINNGGFEAPELEWREWVVAPAGAEWTFEGSGHLNQGGIVRSSQFWPHSGFDPTPDGRQHAFLAGTTVMSQSISGLTVGQAYRLDWLQTFPFHDDGGTALAVELSSPGDTQQILPYTIVNNVDWQRSATDVFVAQSESYTLSVLSDGTLPQEVAGRETLLDDVRIVPVADPAIARTHVSLDMQLLPGSQIDLSVVLSGTTLPGGLGADLLGPLSVDFDAISGTGVVGWHFNPERVHLANDLAGQIDLDILGSADVLVEDPAAILFNPEGSGRHMLRVEDDGQFNLGGTFMAFDGRAHIDLEGPISALYEDLDLLLSDLEADDLGTDRHGVPATQFGQLEFDPTENPNEFLVTVDMPWHSNMILAGNLELELHISARIVAQGTATFTAPEPSAGCLLLSGFALFVTAPIRRRLRTRISS